METQQREALAELSRLNALTAEVAGHHNLKQRIKMTQALKDQNEKLRSTNLRLLDDLKDARAQLKKLAPRQPFHTRLEQYLHAQTAEAQAAHPQHSQPQSHSQPASAHQMPMATSAKAGKALASEAVAPLSVIGKENVPLFR